MSTNRRDNNGFNLFIGKGNFAKQRLKTYFSNILNRC